MQIEKTSHILIIINIMLDNIFVYWKGYNMEESNAFKELKYRAWENFMYGGRLFNNKVTKSITYAWEKKLPVGRSKSEHYEKGVKMLCDIVKENTSAPETTVLVVSIAFSIVLQFSNKFNDTYSIHNPGAYQVGTLDGVTVVVEPTFDEEEKLLFDLATNDIIAIDTIPYDYENDKEELLKRLETQGI